MAHSSHLHSSDDRDLINAFDASLRKVTREELLRGGKNGGAVVTARASSVTILLFLPAFGLSYLATREPFLQHFVERLSWLAAIFAASYTAFYARFASQWSYLVNLYNQISQTELNPGLDRDALARWKAGFISDAVELHLWQKGNFIGICTRYWTSDEVREHFQALPQRGRFSSVATYLDARIETPKA
jgi:hypothetical protein